MNFRAPIVGLGCLLLTSMPSFAQNSDWSYEGTVYLFAPKTEARIGDINAKLSLSDALKNLNFAGMGAFSASNQKWTFVADIMYFNLGFSDRRSSLLVNKVKADLKTTLFSGYALYRIYDTPTGHVNLGGGFRYFDVDTKLSLNGGLLDGQSSSVDGSWTDPVVAVQARFELSDKWQTSFAADYGSFKNNRKTYQLTWTLDYSFADNWLARAGYRYIRVENDRGAQDFRFEQSGPVLGVTYQF